MLQHALEQSAHGQTQGYKLSDYIIISSPATPDPDHVNDMVIRSLLFDSSVDQAEQWPWLCRGLTDLSLLATQSRPTMRQAE